MQLHGWTTECEHYEVWSNVGQDFSDRVGALMRGRLAAYHQLLPREAPALDRPRRIRVFARMPDFKRYVERAHKREMDNYVYFHKGFRRAESEVVGFQVGETALRRRLTHEGWHQALATVIDKTPLWINEGLAESLEVTEVEDGLALRIHPRHTAFLRERVLGLDGGRGGKQLIEAPELVGLERDAWKARRAEAYPSSWALVFHLWHHHPQVLRDYLAALHERGTDAENVQQGRAVLSGLDLARVARDVRAELAERTLVGHAFEEEAQAHEADKKWDEALAAWTRAIEAEDRFHRYWQERSDVNFRLGEHEAARDDAIAALERYPESARAHLALGKAQLRCLRPREARRHLDIARAKGLEKSTQRWLDELDGKRR